MPTTTPTAMDVIRDIHAAALDASAWKAALDGIGRRLDAATVKLVRHEFGSGRDLVIEQSPDDPDFLHDLTAFAARNPWYLSSEPYVSGRVVGGDELLGQRDLLRTDFYRCVLQPRGLRHRLCAVIERSDAVAHVLIAYRTGERGDFEAAEYAELAQALPHLEMSLQCQWRLQEADDLVRCMMAYAEREANPLFLVDAAGVPVHGNRAAQRMLGSGEEGVGLQSSWMAVSSGDDRRVLREAIAQMAADAMSGADVAGTSARAVALAPVAAQEPPLEAVIWAAGSMLSRDTRSRRGLAAISLRSSQASHDPHDCALARRYELTAAQAKVSSLVFLGKPILVIARSLNVSENTVRSHLQQVFQKTNTRGQLALVHLHARICSS